MKKEMIKPIVFIVVVLVLISLAACTLPSSQGTAPATPTVPMEIPVITAVPTEVVEEVEEVEDEVVPIEVEEEIEEPAELPEVEEEEVEEPETEPTPIPVAVDDETEDEVDSEDEIVSATPTAIPFVNTANPDPMVMFYGATNCYVDPNTDSTVSGVASRATALGAFRRNWNFYQVVHPTKPGHVCWVTGDTIRPNQTAFNLKP
jgi:outer membrane biosynthesis protein TonB